MIYGVFGGQYSDWYIVGYFNDRSDAEKYCALRGDNEYYVREMRDLQNDKDLSGVSLKYCHEVVFDKRANGFWEMRDEPDRYTYYIADHLKSNFVKYLFVDWVAFRINLEKDDRKLAEKIAQDYLTELLAYGESKDIKQENVILMNNKLSASERARQEAERQAKLEEKEREELARLKAKYEQ